jgi:regulator of replication initiation timing
METATASDAEARIGRWLEAGDALLAAMGGVLDEYHEVRTALVASEEECERLRTEARDLRQELHSMQAENCALRNTPQDLAARPAAATPPALVPR